MNYELKNVILVEQDLCKAITVFKKMVDDSQSEPAIHRRIEEIEANYLLMRDFMRRGFDDPDRETIYRQSLKKLYAVFVDYTIEELTRQKTELRDARRRLNGRQLQVEYLRQVMESYVQETAFSAIQSTPGHDRIHANEMGQAFDAILTSLCWDVSTMEQMTELLCAPTIEAADAALLVSAVILANSICFDAYKWLAMLHIYQRAEDDQVRQRALVGWFFTMPDKETALYPEIERAMETLNDDENTMRELLELQIQMVYCLHADADTETIRREIIPSLMKNSDFHITQKGIVEMDEDPLNDILNPGAVDKAMEEMEQAVSQMADMQQRGVDIYFGGFSQMKRFPFFYKLHNWFLPFYEDHPDLQKTRDKLQKSKFLQLLFQHGPFCNSDKYSFAFALANIVDRIPENMREMLDSEEAFGPVASSSETHSAAYVRRMYLQDLFRFYRLYQGKGDFPNPFETEGRHQPMLLLLHPLIMNVGIRNRLAEYEKFLYKRGLYNEILAIADHAPATTDHLTIYATTLLRLHRDEEAKRVFASIIKNEPDNLAARRGYASASFRIGQYYDAAEAYQFLITKKPDSLSLQLNLSMTQIAKANIEESHDDANSLFGEVRERLYKLHFEHPDDLRVIRVLAWAQLCEGNIEKADDLYAKILSTDDATADDYLNAGYAKWFGRKIEDAAHLFCKCLHHSPENRQDLAALFEEDRQLLARRGITSSECHLMSDIAEEEKARKENKEKKE